MKPPSFQFYADDFLAGTMDMTNNEVGIYIRLLCVSWSKGFLPADEARLFLLARTNNEPTNEAAVRYIVAEKFVVCDDGNLRNERLETVRGTSAAWKAKSEIGGKASGAQRVGDSNWGEKMAAARLAKRTNNEPTNEPTNEPATNSPSPSPSPSPKLNTYHDHSRIALHWLNEKTGKHFRETDSNLAVISARLKEPDVDIEGVKQMIDRQCALWKPDPKMSEYLRPETLFGKQKFDSYYAGRLASVKSGTGGKIVGPEFCEGWRDKSCWDMTSAERVAYAS